MKTNALVGCGVMALSLWASPTSLPAQTNQPQRFRSDAQLLKSLRQHQPRYFAEYRSGLLVMAGAVATSAATTATDSTTPTQVAGVDEGDCVKTDGTYIFQLNQNRVLAIHAVPETTLTATNVLDFTTETFYPQELYLTGTTLVVIGTAFRNPPPVAKRYRPVWCFSTSTVEAKIYDVSTPASPTKVREVEVDGDYVATRMVGDNLYLVARQYPNYYALANAGLKTTTGLVPAVRDTARSKAYRGLPVRTCFYFPGFDDPNYLIVAGLNISDRHSTLQLNAYLGAGDQVSASTENLYVAGSRNWDAFVLEPLQLNTLPAVTSTGAVAAPIGAMAAMLVIDPAPTLTNPEQTVIYKFALNNGQPTFVAAGTVPGSILNSYAMDEFSNTFRVATTEHAWWWLDRSTARNNLFVLNTNMTITGSLTNFAAGEQIYAARFLGDRAFLVTYQQIDPLFAIDLRDPTQPVVVGQLTMPGYSQFLLPYDANHLIGFGKNVTVVTNQTTGDVPWWDGSAFYQGLKIALFDVTDMCNPTLLFTNSIGDRGSDSPVLWDPHALLFDRGRGLLAFPVSVTQVTNADAATLWQWGETVFQGVYVYDVSVTNGFVLRGTITQIPAGDNLWSDGNRQINRVLFIGNDLFTLSTAAVKVNALDTLADKATLALPQPPQNTLPITFQAIMSKAGTLRK